MYAGVIRADIMPYVLRYFEPFMKKGQVIFDLYTRSSVSEYRAGLDEVVNDYFVMHGFMERNTILEEERKADILLAMGNSNSDFISSKIFELIATGKKIVHVYSYERDSALPYFKRYSNCCLVDIRDDEQKNVQKIADFLNAPLKRIAFEELEKLYYMNTPQYTVKTILELIK